MSIFGERYESKGLCETANRKTREGQREVVQERGEQEEEDDETNLSGHALLDRASS